MSRLTAIGKALDLVEDHLKAEIAVADMAEAAAYSLYHFCRTFNAVVHHTPYDYLMRRRLSESAHDLVETDKKIIDIAFDYRFNSPETYSRAFKRMFDRSPSEWREQGGLDERFLLSRPSRAYLEHIGRGDCLRPVLEERAAFHVAGLMALVRDGESVIADLWDVLLQELGGADGADLYGIVQYPSGWEQRGVLYMAAFEIAAPDLAGPMLAVKTIPAFTYARFTHQGPAQDLHWTRAYVYQTWLPKADNRLAYPLEIEARGRDLSDPDAGQALYIPIEP